MTLYFNDKGPDVEQLQNDLNTVGLGPLQIDGDFGIITLDALKAYQKHHGLTVDGIYGPNTSASLKSTVMALGEQSKKSNGVNPEKDRPSPHEKGQGLLWCPFVTVSKVRMPTKGKYKNNYPSGLIVHFTAGRSFKGDSDALATIAYGKEQGYAYYCMSRDGEIFAPFALDEWGYHAGASNFNNHSVSDQFIGLEICNAGKLKKIGDKFYSWFNEEIPEHEVSMIQARDNASSGYYHKYTKEQEASLIQFCLWLKWNNPTVFDLNRVMGHSEVAIPAGRKDDPAGSLSMSMHEFRMHLLRQSVI